MKRPTRRHWIVAAAAVLLALLLLWLHSCDTGCREPGGGGGSTGSGTVTAPAPFTVTGDLTREIRPGALVPLDLTLTNTNPAPIVIDQIAVTVGPIDAPNADADHPCTDADFDVRPLRPGVAVTVPGGSTATLAGLSIPEADWPAVGMLNLPHNQNGCKGATLTLRYEATATEVTR